MAAEKIELQFGAVYDAGKAFSQGQKDLKDFGRANKDALYAGKDAVKQLAGAFSDDLGNAVGAASSAIGSLAKGGIWGLIGVAATQAIGYVVDKFKEAKERAKEFAESLKKDVVEGWNAAFKSTDDGFRKVSENIDKTKKDVTDLTAALGGEITANANIKVQELHVQTLQKLTNEMDAAARSVILAQEQYAKAQITTAAATEQAQLKQAAATEAVAAATDRRVAAEKALAESEQRQEALNDSLSETIAMHKGLKGEVAMLEEKILVEGEKDAAATALLQSVKAELAEFEKAHKDEIALATNAEKAVTERKKAVEAAGAEQEAATRALTAANRNLEVVTAQNAATMEEANFKLHELQVAQEKEKKAREQKAAEEEKEAKYYEAIQRIETICFNNKVEEAEYVELYTQALKDGYSEQTINTLLQKKLNAEIKERTERMKAEREAAAAGKSSAAMADLKNTIKEAIKDTPINTNVNTGGVGQGVDKSKGVIKLGDLQREVRDEQRQMRDKQDAVKQSSAAMQAYLKGQMSAEVAAKFEEKIKANGMTMKDFGTMTEKALNSQLLTHTEALDQKKAIMTIKTHLEKLGLK